MGSRPPRRCSSDGCIKLDGGAPVPGRISTGFGNIRIDLRDLRTDAEVIELDLSSGLGNIEVIVAEGVDAELDGWTGLGKRKVDLAPVPGSPAPRGSSSGRTRSSETFAAQPCSRRVGQPLASAARPARSTAAAPRSDLTGV